MRSRRVYYPIVALTILLLCTAGAGAIWAQTVNTYDEAVDWLDENPNSPQFGSVLYTAVEYAPSVEAVSDLLDEYLQDVMDRSDRGRVLLRAGIVQELSHQYNRARLSYARAVDADPSLWEASLRRSSLAIEEGDVSEAVLLLTQVIHQAPTRDIQRRAAMLRIRAYAMQDETERAFTQAAALVGYPGEQEEIDPPEMNQTVEPEALLLLYETAQITGNTHAQEWSATALHTSFDRDAPEASLAQDGESPDTIATYYPSPSRIFGGMEMRSVPIVEERAPRESSSSGDDDPGRSDPQRETPQERGTGEDQKREVAGIQTGSFRDGENAQYMARDIRELGFEAEVQEVEINDEVFFRVIVPLPEDSTPESAQETVVRLKEQGIEGFLVFDSP
ncbi:MAG: SPOR domain-containing protein [Alkalispirochaeta sp.]